MISQDAKLNLLYSEILAALMENDALRFARTCETAAQIARTYLVDTSAPKVEITQQTRIIPFPDEMGLRGIGFAENEPFLIVAFPSDGKTLFCFNLIAHLIRDKFRVVVLHNEGNSQDYAVGAYRVLWSIMPAASARRITKEDAFAEKDRVMEWLEKSSLNIVNVRRDGPTELIARITKIMAKDEADVILFDWLQNVNIKDDKHRFQGWSFIAQQLEELCLKWKKPVGVFGQMNRDGGREKITLGAPSLGVIEGCPQMEQKSGVVLNLRNGTTNLDDWDGKPFFWVNVAKNRHGPRGQRNVMADFTSGSFIGQMSPLEYEKVIAHIKMQRKRTS